MPGSVAPSCFARRMLAVAVGLFASWQLIYLPAANFIDLVPRRLGPHLEPVYDLHQAKGAFTKVEPLQRAADYTGDVLDFWSEATGQEQGWSLFTPGMPPYTIFVAVEFRFADGTNNTVLSRFEPIDKRHPRLRPPLINNRLFNFEAQFVYPVWFASDEAIEQYPDFYRNLPEIVRSCQTLIRVWLAWQLKQYQTTHANHMVPVEVILKHRFIPTPHPEEPTEWTQPVRERPFARWYPGSDALDAYDAVNHRFVPVRAKP